MSMIELLLSQAGITKDDVAKVANGFSVLETLPQRLNELAVMQTQILTILQSLDRMNEEPQNDGHRSADQRSGT